MDTIGGTPRRLLIALRDSSGAPIEGALITLTVSGLARNVFRVLPDSAPEARGLIPSSTNAEGNAHILLAHWFQAGISWLRVAIAEAAPGTRTWVDSIRVQTLTGRPVSIGMPLDTAAYQGATIQWRAAALDRFLNPTSAPVSLEAGGSGVSVSGATVRVVAGPSRQLIRARSGNLADSAWLSVVPPGTILARDVNPDPDDPHVFVQFNLDGSQRTPVLRSLDPPFIGSTREMSQHWIPAGGDDLVFFDGAAKSLYRRSAAGQVVPLFPRVSENDVWPQTSSNGWVYFAGYHPLAQTSVIHRARLNGDSLQQLSPASPQAGDYDTYPSPSPNGQRLAFATSRGASLGSQQLHVLTLATGAIDTLGVEGNAPRWSPTGLHIAFARDNALFVFTVASRAVRRVSSAGIDYEPWVSWSPDGQWIIAARFGPSLDVINVSTGLTLPIGFTEFLAAPAWRPF